MPPFRLLPSLLLTASPLLAQADWERHPLPSPMWNEFTHVQAMGETIYCLHGRDVDVRQPDGSWSRWPQVLPVPVDMYSATCVDRAQRILVVPGGMQPGFTLDPRTRAVESIPGLARPNRRGANVCVDKDNIPYTLIGGRLPDWGRLTATGWEDLPRVGTVNPVGAYSSGLFAISDTWLIAFGDHHVNTFDLTTKAWIKKDELFCQLGFRPALDRGGMAAQDPESRAVVMTLGKASRSLGVLMPERKFYHLRPRLPFLLADPDRSLCVTVGAKGTRVVLLSRQQGALFSIARADLTPIGMKDQLADTGSRFVTWNSRQGGSHGDLSRERDSACNLAFVKPFLYVQRKNIVRRIHYDTWAHSPVGAGFQYGKEFAVAGAAFCYDGQDRIYVYNGYSNEFWALHPFQTDKPDAPRSATPVPIEEAMVKTLAKIPEFVGVAPRDGRATNTPMAMLGGKLYALFDPTTRVLQCYDPATDTWRGADVLPAGVVYTDRDGADLMGDGERLWFLGGNTLIDWRPDRGFGPLQKLSFGYSSDGGMAVFDRKQKLIYLTMGGGTRDFAVIRPADGKHKLLRDFFPDVVSVPGRRMWLDYGGTNGKGDGVDLFLFRGHDCAEYWRTRISGDLAVLPD